MRRTILLSLAVIGVLALLFALWWTPMREPFRSWRIKQQKPLVDGITMEIDDLYFLPRDEGRKLFRVRCRYLEGDPNDHYAMRGSLLASSTGPELDYGIYGQSAAANDGKGGKTILWSFTKAPEHHSPFVMRITFWPKSGTRPGEGERYVDFTLPYLPKLTPMGETYMP